MSEAAFRRNFRSSIGQSPGEYIAFCRVRRAQSKRVFSDLSILDIALSVGFDDPSGLYRCFQNHCGMSPSKYRQMFRKP